MNVAEIIAAAIEREGGSKYTNHPNDRGGPTRWGITQKVARANGYTGDMAALPRHVAESIYINTFVNKPGFNKVLEVSLAIGEEMVDTGINMGPGIPGPWLQRILNVLNKQARAYPDLVIDGELGPVTIGALSTLLRQRGNDGEKVVVRMLNCLQGARYLELAENREKNEDFIFGWMLNRVGT